jgi:hypothetical protein
VTRLEKNGDRIAINAHVSPLRYLAGKKTITQWEREAGEHFEAAHRLAWGGGGTNVIAKMMVLGVGGIRGGGIDEGLHVKQWAAGRIDQIRQLAGFSAYSILLDVAVHQLSFGRGRGKRALSNLELLRAGLGAAADVFGVERR